MKNTEEPHDAVTEIVAQSEQEALPWKCPKCPKRFTTKAGVVMHDRRVHTKTLKSWGQKGFKPNPDNKPRKIYPSDRSVVKRRKYREMRDRYHAMGLDAKGRPFKSETGKKVSTSMMRRKGPVKWTPERKAKFRATMRKKAQARRWIVPPPTPPILSTKKRLQFVYPISNKIPAEQDKPEQEKPTNIRKVRFCPFCGEHLERHLYETP
jgi:hypothetical protein